MPHVSRVRHLRDYVLRLEFDNGVTKDVDLRDEFHGEIFEPLRDLELFRRVAINPDTRTIEWPNGANFSPEFLLATGNRGGPAVPLRYAVVFERSETGFGAFVPDLPGCVAAAETETEVRRLIAEAVQLHVDSLRKTVQPIPEPSHSVGYVDVDGATAGDRENEAWDRELARREQEIDTGAAETVSADVVFEELDELLDRPVDRRRTDQESGQQAEAKRLLREVNALPLDVRLQLVMDVWDGIAASPEGVPVPESHLRELESRLQSLEAGADERLERDVTEWIDQVQDDEGWTE